LQASETVSGLQIADKLSEDLEKKGKKKIF
jgi:hypothetical protein